MEDLGLIGRCYDISCIQWYHVLRVQCELGPVPYLKHLAISCSFTLACLPHALASGCLTKRVTSGSFVFSTPLWLVPTDIIVVL